MNFEFLTAAKGGNQEWIYFYWKTAVINKRPPNKKLSSSTDQNSERTLLNGMGLAGWRCVCRRVWKENLEQNAARNEGHVVACWIRVDSRGALLRPACTSARDSPEFGCSGHHIWTRIVYAEAHTQTGRDRRRVRQREREKEREAKSSRNIYESERKW